MNLYIVNPIWAWGTCACMCSCIYTCAFVCRGQRTTLCVFPLEICPPYSEERFNGSGTFLFVFLTNIPQRSTYPCLLKWGIHTHTIKPSSFTWISSIELTSSVFHRKHLTIDPSPSPPCLF